MLDEQFKLLIEDASDQMDKTLEWLRHELNTIRAGRASPAMIENIKIDYYGSQTPLSQCANISAPQPDLLVVQPWDPSVLSNIERGITAANVGLNPSNDGQLIRIPVPPLSEERRHDLVKTARTRGEEAKVGIRNIRRSIKDEIKHMQQDENLPEDMRYESEDRLQEITDHHTERVDKLLERKEAEILEV